MVDFTVEYQSEGELIDKLRQVKLRGSDVMPFKDAYISIETLDPEILAPTQRYVLDYELKKVEQLRWMIMEEYGYDILRLSGYLKVTYPGEWDPGMKKMHDRAEIIDMLPPVIEEYVDFRGGINLVVDDGQHRCYLAYMMGLPINVAYVRGVNKNFQYYAYPLPSGWDDVEIISQIPNGYIKKFHIARDHKKLYRDFNTQFSNIGDSRPYGQ